ncbi:hypothetical protein LCGC14_1917640, partial [marine sediment metagenome]
MSPVSSAEAGDLEGSAIGSRLPFVVPYLFGPIGRTAVWASPPPSWAPGPRDRKTVPSALDTAGWVGWNAEGVFPLGETFTS